MGKKGNQNIWFFVTIQPFEINVYGGKNPCRKEITTEDTEVHRGKNWSLFLLFCLRVPPCPLWWIFSPYG